MQLSEKGFKSTTLNWAKRPPFCVEESKLISLKPFSISIQNFIFYENKRVISKKDAEQAFTCWMSTKGTQEKDVKHVQSYQ